MPSLSSVDPSATSIDSIGLDRLPVVVNAATLLPVDGKTGSAGGKTSASATLRSAHGTSSSLDSAQHGSRVVEAQSSSPTADASVMAHEVAGASGVVRTAGDSAEGSTATTAGPDSRDIFATLDAEGAEGTPTWIHAGTQRAEAGFQDPSLGWVGIRANVSGGGVHADLTAGSADAAQTLGSHLSGLHAYLSDQHTPVETLTLTAAENGSAGWSSDQSAGQGMQQGTGQQTAGQETATGADNGSQISPYQSSTAPTGAASQLQAGFDDSAQAAMPGGTHISVMA
jgi:hypothetical protein